MGKFNHFFLKYMSKIKNILQILIITLLVFDCGSNGSLKKSKGELVGVKGKKYYPEKPFGMVLVPGGSFIMGKSDDDIAGVQDAPTKTVTVRSFYMDETEITNAEYRQYVNWVRDSVIRTALAEAAKDYLNVGPADNTGESVEGADGNILINYAFLGSDQQLTPFQKYDSINNDNANQRLNWDIDLFLNRDDYPDDMAYIEIVESFFKPKEETFNNVRALKVDLLKYKYTSYDVDGEDGYINSVEKYKRGIIEIQYNEENGWEDISEPGGITTFRNIDEDDARFNEIVEMNEDFFATETEGSLSRSNYIKEIPVRVYPDTTVWVKDFNYSYNNPMVNNYFSHEAYSTYPVVGVSWHQAQAFCDWRTFMKNSYQKTKKKKSLVPNFRLPTEAEWEYAARGGLQGAMYPWGGPYTKNDRGCFMANFKPMRGDYAVDQALYTVEANAYDPNGYNLYNMSGNVAEWVDSSYEPEAYDFSITMNPNVNNKSNNKKVIRGGSWKDVKYFLQVSSRDYEYADQPRSYIGFRTVHDYLGADLTANAITNSSIRKQNNRRSSIK